MLRYDDQAEMIQWASEVIGWPFRPDAVAIGWGDPLRAVTVFDNFSHCGCNIHIASDGSKRWLTRGYMRAVFAYPFIQCGFNRVTGLVPSKNTEALRFDMKLGFKVEGKSPEAMPDDDIIILGLLRRNCLFIPEKYRN